MTPPPLLVLTDRSQCSRPLRDVVAAAVDAGARGVVLREKDLPDDERTRLADDFLALLEPVDGLLIRAGRAGAGGDDAVHLASQEPFPPRRPALVGRSCHSAAELARARDEGCDYAFLSPIFSTPSKPGYGPVLGVEGFARLVAGAPPTWALGGVRPEHVPALTATGAAGVAVMGPVMRDPGLVSNYLSVLG
ncbi:MAG: Thiazole tautomerase TenI [uncultured Blastococcus sp.]|uniref:Thiazole tautomerase TenI n=1 Tax=uncultured Blastococcus sp. TaxID=217144 RepID=A0A6J4HVI7_9ACTN|nr:MAG: Thiazole tautomerase TenI [uncultured Blastococcus sp.]